MHPGLQLTPPASAPASSSQAPAWFCLRTRSKHEHIAAAHLSRETGIEVYLPRIRFRRHTSGGPKWFNEALFPSYLFARFNLIASLRRVHHSPGIVGIVHFGDQWPSVPDHVVDELRATVSADAVHVIHDEYQPGDEVIVADGLLRDLKAVVTRLLPARQRVAVLLNFLGRQTEVELPKESLLPETDRRRHLF